jgi:RNA polymerase sigma-70 factor (ECF subfamily)
MITRTTTSLLEDLDDPANQAVWEELDARLRPVLIGLACRMGLPPQDAADAAQETLTRFLRAYREGKYDRERGRLRSWIVGIARHCILDLQKQWYARREQRGVSALGEVPGESQLEAWWDTECEREILRQAVSELRDRTNTDPQTIRAFEMIAFDRRPPAEVAGELDMSMNDVYLAKHRCLKRLRSIVDRISELYE